MIVSRYAVVGIFSPNSLEWHLFILVFGKFHWGCNQEIIRFHYFIFKINFHVLSISGLKLGKKLILKGKYLKNQFF